jgi:hypothetical protein
MTDVQPPTQRGDATTTTPVPEAVPEDTPAPRQATQPPGESRGTDETGRTVQGFYLVRNSIYTVGALFVVGMIGAVVVGYTGGDASTISAMLTAVTGVIGSLVGAYFGIQVGNAGRQETEERVEGRRQDAQETLNKALAVLPREDAAAVLDVDLPEREVQQPGVGRGLLGRPPPEPEDTTTTS